MCPSELTARLAQLLSVCLSFLHSPLPVPVRPVQVAALQHPHLEDLEMGGLRSYDSDTGQARSLRGPSAPAWEGPFLFAAHFLGDSDASVLTHLLL